VRWEDQDPVYSPCSMGFVHLAEIRAEHACILGHSAFIITMQQGHVLAMTRTTYSLQQAVHMQGKTCIKQALQSPKAADLTDPAMYAAPVDQAVEVTHPHAPSLTPVHSCVFLLRSPGLL
jgi:hypothetical protein